MDQTTITKDQIINVVGTAGGAAVVLLALGEKALKTTKNPAVKAVLMIGTAGLAAKAGEFAADGLRKVVGLVEDEIPGVGEKIKDVTNFAEKKDDSSKEEEA